MKSLQENPVLSASHRMCGAMPLCLVSPGVYYLGIALALSFVLLYILGVCSCTLFFSASVFTILLSTLLIGTSAFSAISREKEKKTLDSLRLTLLLPEDVITGKLYPEFQALCRLLLVLSPTVLTLGACSEYGIGSGMIVIFMSLLAGGLSLLGGFILSSLCKNTSQAIVAGLTLKVLWLLATPLLDMVLAALMVSGTPPPVFISMSPLAALYALILPQAMTGAWSILPWSYFLLAPLALLALWFTARHLYESGGAARAYRRRKAGILSGKEWSLLAWLGVRSAAMAGIFSGPVFKRELSLQLRNGAGRLPGYLVFIAIFLAPYLYARCWGINECMSPQRDQRPSSAQVVSDSALISSSRHPVVPGGSAVIMTRYGTYFTLRTHTLRQCLRWTMYRFAGVPLPSKLIEEKKIALMPGYNINSCNPLLYRPGSHQGVPDVLTKKQAQEELTVPVTKEREKAIDSTAIRLGLIGAIWLLLIYLAIRGCCFTIAAVTGERDRRTWEDMALAGISPPAMLVGKLAGSLIMPVFQMTIVFPMLFFFVLSGNMKPQDVLSLYCYALSITIASGVLGLWASATSASTHEAQGKALALVFILFLVAPLALPFVWIAAVIAVPLALIGSFLNARKIAPWLILSLAAALSPASTTPLLAPLFFVSTLWPVNFLSLFPGSLVPPGFLNAIASILIVTVLSAAMYREAAHVIGEPGDRMALGPGMTGQGMSLPGRLSS